MPWLDVAVFVLVGVALLLAVVSIPSMGRYSKATRAANRYAEQLRKTDNDALSPQGLEYMDLLQRSFEASGHIQVALAWLTWALIVLTIVLTFLTLSQALPR